MSVLVSDRTESKFEAITYSIELHDMLIDFMQRSFGVKDLDQLVRVRYAHGKDATEDFSRYRYLMLNYKNRIDQLASMLTSNVRAANSIYPTTLHEYEQRRDYQNTAIVNCEQLLKELQRIVEIFEVDVTTMRRKLKKLAGKVKNGEISYENVENMFRGWMGGFYKLLSKEQRKNLIGLFENLFEKSIKIVDKRMIITDKIE